MQSSAKNSDKFASVMVAAFLIMGTTHFACRYDIGTVIEGFFQKASAETIMPQNSANEASTSGSVLSDQIIISKSIARNPFLMPVSATPNLTKPYQTASVGNYSSSPSAKTTVPVFPAEPQLRGIISKGDKHIAIIEYKGTSNYYSCGQNIGDYTVSNINSKSVYLYSSANPLELYLGGNTK
ncbi:MAG: hypothetical protein AB7E34_03145 [Acidaminococcaceae bacterium]